MRQAELGWLLTTGEKKDWTFKAGTPVLGGRFAKAASAAENHSTLSLAARGFLQPSQNVINPTFRNE